MTKRHCIVQRHTLPSLCNDCVGDISFLEGFLSKVDSRDQSSIFITSLIEIPDALAVDVAAALVERAPKMKVSMPAAFRTSLSHLPILTEETGFLTAIRSCPSLWARRLVCPGFVLL